MNQSSSKPNACRKLPKNKPKSPILFGNTFPLSLIRRNVNIEPKELSTLQSILSERGFMSFWGHKNTLNIAGNVLNLDITPASERPALSLDNDNFPELEGRVFDECWVLSPDYRRGFRPAVGVEVGTEDIIDWQVLRLSW